MIVAPKVAQAELRRREVERDKFQAELARRHLVEFCDRMAIVDGRPFVHYRHSLKVIEHLEALERGDIEKFVLTIPQRHGKSYLSTERFPAWFLGRNPRKSMILAAYGQTLADRQSRRVRNLVQSPPWPFPNVKVAQDSAAVSQWALESGAIVKAAGIDGSIGGYGGDLLIFDDPHKNSAEADSDVYSDATWKFFTDVFLRRQQEGARFVITTNRWNTYDVVGRLLNTADAKNWTVLNLPGVADPTPEEPDPLGRAKGELLWPEGPPLPTPESGLITTRGFAAQVQGRPSKDDGALFKRAYFTERYVTPPIFKTSVVSVDGAWKEGVSNSRSAIAHWGTDGINYYVVDAWAAQPEYVDLRRKVIDFFNHSKADELAVEDAASGSALISELRRSTSIPIIGVKAIGSKEARAESVTPQFESKRVRVPERASWVDEWIEEHIRFPAKPNDLVDTTSLALERLAKPEEYVYAGWV